MSKTILVISAVPARREISWKRWRCVSTRSDSAEAA